MAEINLLPWRELKREQEKKNFVILLISAVIVAIAVVFLMNYYFNGLLDQQTRRNQRLQTEITLLDKQIEAIKELKKMREGLIARMKIVQELQATRTLTVHLFDELIKVLPNGVYLTNVKRTDNKVVLQGYTESNGDISVLMRNIQNNPWLHAPKLTEIKKSKETENKDKTDNNENNNEFSLSIILGEVTRQSAHE